MMLKGETEGDERPDEDYERTFTFDENYSVAHEDEERGVDGDSNSGTANFFL